MSPEMSKAGLDYTRDAVLALQKEMEGLTQRLHREYFEPFDRIIERRAEYALKLIEEGKKADRVVEEVETMEKFRRYVDALENLTDERVMYAWIGARRQFQRLEHLAQMYENLFWQTVESEQFFIDLSIRQCRKIQQLEAHEQRKEIRG